MSLLILVVEDNIVNQRLAESVLVRAGHEVVIAPNGRDGVDRVMETDFDIVLMDLQMPILGGLEATIEIREWERRLGGHVPIIAVTARALPGDRDACVAAGMDGYMSKPIRGDALLALVASLTGGTVSPGDSRSPFVPEDDVLDLAALLATVGDDRELLGDLARLFLDDVPEQLQAMRQALAEQDGTALSAVAHAMKGAAGSLSARRVATLVGRLEAMGRAHTFAEGPRLLTLLTQATTDLAARLTAVTEDGAQAHVGAH